MNAEVKSGAVPAASNRAEDKTGVLILTPTFSPNIGGPETHLDDLVEELDQRGFPTYVQTYSPLTTPGISWQPHEKRGREIHIRRYHWYGQGLFHTVENYPLLDFLYLTPYLFLRTFWFMLRHHRHIGVIHAHGLNAGLVGLGLRLFFPGCPVVVSIHAIYERSPASRTAKLVKWILNRTNKVLCLSDASRQEMINFGVDPPRLGRFRYWINLDRFSPPNEDVTPERSQLTILFVGRLIPKKGVRELLQVARRMPEERFVFIGVGPMEEELRNAAHEMENVEFLGAVENSLLADHLRRVSILCVPSQYEEGFGRVVMEAVACGVPVVASNRGGLTEALDDSVAILIPPTPDNLQEAISTLKREPERLAKMKRACRAYALEHFSTRNLEMILQHYQ